MARRGTVVKGGLLTTVTGWLGRSGTAGGPLLRVPPADPGWVHRDELDHVVRTLASGSNGTVGLVSAVRKAEGFGTTSLAVAACHHERVRRYFSGGVVWLSVGPHRTDAETIASVGRLAVELGDERPQVCDPEAVTARLAEVLAKSSGRVLLVVDGVWDADQLDPFRPVAEKSRLLVTTRQARALPGHSVVIQVDRMTRQAATRLVTLGLPSARTGQLSRLLESAGDWPPVLTWVNRRLAVEVARGVEVNAAMERVIGRLRGVGSAEPDMALPQQREAAIRTVVELGMESLSVGDRDLCLELGVFPEETDIPLSVVALLWQGSGLDAGGSERLCARLAEAIPVTLRREEGSEPVLRLPDPLCAYACSGAGLGQDGIVAVHRKLIDQARTLLPATDAGWWNLPPDAHYLWHNLTYHLFDAERGQELTELVGDVRWILAKLHRAGPQAFVADLALCETPQTAELDLLLTAKGDLLGDLESEGLSLGNRLTQLSASPELAAGIRRHLGTVPHLSPLWPESPHPWGPADVLAVAPDGSWLVSGGQDGTVRLWGAKGQERAVVAGHTGSVWRVLIAPDGSWFVTAGEDGRVRLWGPDGAERATRDGHGGPVWAAVMAPDGSWFATGGDDGTVRLWDADGREHAVLGGHVGPVSALAVAPDGSWFASGDDKAVRLWNVGGAKRATLGGHVDLVNGLVIAPDGSWLVSASFDGSLRLWGADGAARGILKGHTGEVLEVAVAPDGSWLASAGDDGTVRLWNADGTRRAVLTGHTRPVLRLVAAPGGGWLASASADRTVRVWSTAEGGSCVAAMRTDSGVSTVEWLPGDKGLAVGLPEGVRCFALRMPSS
ncbi:NB-ARC domain-containing protein [Rhizohabitans arisaemae]|uniref:NB-ARC domain-containing protein n=1 Tax=Rhizohabitans arisaemae TaxID=2720610 RepID=UPI0024B2091A|nr:NB-ARC domain-containing protein [Rhizohabitans arisaemae]